MPTEQGAARGLRGVLGRVGRCVLTYLLIHTAAWVVISQRVWWDDTFLEIMTLGAICLLIIGMPTLLIAVFAVCVHNRMEVLNFRFLLSIPLILCTWPLLAINAGEPLMLQVMAQIAFAALIPAPLFPENWLGARVPGPSPGRPMATEGDQR